MPSDPAQTTPSGNRMLDETMAKFGYRAPPYPHWAEVVEVAIERERARSKMPWQPIETAPRDGNGFIAYGRHDKDCPIQDGKDRYQKGDHWWALLTWDVWRAPHQFVFCKDGTPGNSWGEPTHWLPLPAPPEGRADA